MRFGKEKEASHWYSEINYIPLGCLRQSCLVIYKPYWHLTSESFYRIYTSSFPPLPWFMSVCNGVPLSGVHQQSCISGSAKANGHAEPHCLVNLVSLTTKER